MKLKQIEEIAKKKVPIWQPTLLVTLLVLGYTVVPILAKKSAAPPKQETLGTTLGIETLAPLTNEVKNKAINSTKPYIAQAQEQAGAVLGIAQNTVQTIVQNIASKSAETAQEFVFDNTIGKILQNIKTLPTDQQELIQKAICK
jgi:hypothetical protein